MNVTLPRELQRQRLASLLLPLVCLLALSALAFTAVAQEGRSGRDGREDRGHGGPTVLATPAFLINTLPPPRVLCSVINLGPRTREVTTTLRINHPAFTPAVQTSTIGAERFGGLDAGGSTGGRPVPPVRGFCEFESSDVSLLRASVSVFDGQNQVPQYAPATPADPGDRHGRPTSTVLATPPFTVAPSQLAACLVVNLGATPQAVTVTMHTDDGAPPRISSVTVQPDVVGGTEVLVNATQPTQVSCEFGSSNATALRASGTILDQTGNRSVRQIVPAL
jgi:hypothetical protein